MSHECNIGQFVDARALIRIIQSKAMELPTHFLRDVLKSVLEDIGMNPYKQIRVSADFSTSVAIIFVQSHSSLQ